MSLVPIPRESMRTLKDEADEKHRIRRVNEIVARIYEAAMHRAKTTYKSSYVWNIKRRFDDDEYMITIFNTGEITNALEVLFPGCSVEHTMMAKGSDGKMHDVSNMGVTEMFFIGNPPVQESIIIDWS